MRVTFSAPVRVFAIVGGFRVLNPALLGFSIGPSRNREALCGDWTIDYRETERRFATIGLSTIEKPRGALRRLDYRLSRNREALSDDWTIEKPTAAALCDDCFLGRVVLWSERDACTGGYIDNEDWRRASRVRWRGDETTRPLLSGPDGRILMG